MVTIANRLRLRGSQTRRGIRDDADGQRITKSLTETGRARLAAPQDVSHEYCFRFSNKARRLGKHRRALSVPDLYRVPAGGPMARTHRQPVIASRCCFAATPGFVR